MYGKYACWCKEVSERKASDIELAHVDSRRISQEILKLRGSVAVLTSEMSEKSAAIDQHIQQQASLTSIRSKENTAFFDETSELKQALTALEKSIGVLVDATRTAKAEPMALIQQRARGQLAVRVLLDTLPIRSPFPSEKISLLNDFSEASSSAEYSPQSSTIQGILKDMYNTFAADLESTTEQEASKNTIFENLIAEKIAQVILLKDQRTELEGKKAKAVSALADAVQTYDDTAGQLKADVELFDSTKAVCEDKHQAFTARVSLRSEELSGIEDAIRILSSDNARATFQKAIKPGFETFLQVGAEMSSNAPAARAYDALKAQAMHSHSMRLASLAARVRLAKVGHFGEVLAAIEQMITTLRSEGAADIAKRDQCKNEYWRIDKEAAKLRWEISNNDATIDKLEDRIERRMDEKVQTSEEIASVNATISAMKDQRAIEHEAFLHAKESDNNATALLESARDAILSYYVKNSIDFGPTQGSVKGLVGMSLVQSPPEFDISRDQAPEAIFSHEGSRKDQSKNIVSILTMVIEDLRDEIQNGIQAEAAAQLAYERQLKAAEKLRDELSGKLTTLTGIIADRHEEKRQETQTKETNQLGLNDEMDYEKSIKDDCDWIIRAFAGRAERRAAEMSGLTSAKEYLAGVTFEGSFNDDKLPSTQFLGLSK